MTTTNGRAAGFTLSQLGILISTPPGIPVPRARLAQVEARQATSSVLATPARTAPTMTRATPMTVQRSSLRVRVS